MIDDFNGEYRFLSNFYMHLGSSVEHRYQARKTLNHDEAQLILSASTPAVAKKLGRAATLRDDWEDVKLRVMKYLVREKFQDPELARMLLKTVPHELVEGNWWGDAFWGVCRGVGENHLGKILMEVRDELESKQQAVGDK